MTNENLEIQKDTQIIIDFLANIGLDRNCIKNPKWIDYPYKFEYTYLFTSQNIHNVGYLSIRLSDKTPMS